jgi:hypothetical protein
MFPTNCRKVFGWAEKSIESFDIGGPNELKPVGGTVHRFGVITTESKLTEVTGGGFSEISRSRLRPQRLVVLGNGCFMDGLPKSAQSNLLRDLSDPNKKCPLLGLEYTHTASSHAQIQKGVRMSACHHS